MKLMSGAEIFCESLRREGVKTVFGLPGGVVLKIFDVLCQQKDIDLVSRAMNRAPRTWLRVTPKPPAKRVFSW